MRMVPVKTTKPSPTHSHLSTHILVCNTLAPLTDTPGDTVLRERCSEYIPLIMINKLTAEFRNIFPVTTESRRFTR